PPAEPGSVRIHVDLLEVLLRIYPPRREQTASRRGSQENPRHVRGGGMAVAGVRRAMPPTPAGRRPRRCLAVLGTAMSAALLLQPVRPAQVTTARLVVGDADDVSCQPPPGSFPALTGGVRARADLRLAYDSGTGILRLTVANVSPVVPGEANPLLVDLWLNLPDRAVTGARLLSQITAGGADPGWRLASDRKSTRLNS